MEVVVAQGLSGWVWTAPGVRSQQVLANPVWTAINLLLRARGLRFADAATREQFFPVDAAICDEQVAKLVGSGTEVQFRFQLALLKPSSNHLTANFADEDYDFVANSISLYDSDHAALIGGGAGPLFLKSTVNLSGTASKSQAARIITVRLREELGGITPAEWKAARQIAFKTTVLALNTKPGMVCSMTQPTCPAARASSA